jgi:hypothetical protein
VEGNEITVGNVQPKEEREINELVVPHSVKNTGQPQHVELRHPGRAAPTVTDRELKPFL